MMALSRSLLLTLFCLLLTVKKYDAAPPDKNTRPLWQTTEFASWSMEDARVVLSDSPWAKQKSLSAAGRPTMTVVEPATAGAAPPTAGLGNSTSTNTGAGTNAGAASAEGSSADPVHDLNTSTTPSGMNNAIGAPVPRPPVTVLWASAAPVRLAILKLRSNGKPLDQGEIAKRTEARESYIVAVSGLPLPQGGTDAKALAKKATLQIKGRPGVQATESSYRRIGDSDVFFFHFSRSALPLTPGDGDVDFRMRLGTMEVAQTFKLAQMIYQGRLAL